MNPIIHSILLKFSRSYREEKEAAALKRQQEEDDEKWHQLKAEIYAYNLELMTSIIDNCPEGDYAIFIKFACGNWPEDMLREEAHTLLPYVQKGSNSKWGYLQGSGLGCVNPDHEQYQRDPERILKALTTEPNRWLTATRIRRWRYVSLSEQL